MLDVTSGPAEVHAAVAHTAVRVTAGKKQGLSKLRPDVGQGIQPSRTGPLLLAEQYRLGMLGVAALHK